MRRDAIDELRYRADRTATRLFVLAGISCGLILGVALLFLQAGQYRGALAIAGVALVVGAFMIIAAHHIRFSAMSLYEVGADLRAESVTLRRRQDEFRERFAEVRARDQGVERALLDLRTRVRLLESEVLAEGEPQIVDVAEPRVRRPPAIPRPADARAVADVADLPPTQALPLR